MPRAHQLNRLCAPLRNTDRGYRPDESANKSGHNPLCFLSSAILRYLRGVLLCTRVDAASAKQEIAYEHRSNFVLSTLSRVSDVSRSSVYA